MTGDNVKVLRRALSGAAGRHISQADLGIALGLRAENADRTVRNWEATQPSGPASVALTYLAQGALDDVMRQVVPEYVAAEPLGDGPDHELVLRLWWPRFVGAVISAEVEPEPEQQWVWIEPGVERLALAMWIDDPRAFGDLDEKALLQRAATLFQEHTLDAVEG